MNPNKEKANRILIFDLYETLVENVRMDFNLGLKPIWEAHYRDKCSFEEIKAYGEELYFYMLEQHKNGLEFPFVKDELPLYAKKFGGEALSMSVEEEAEFVNRCNEVRVYDGLPGMLENLHKENVPMYVLSNSGFSGGALKIMLSEVGIEKYFEEVWSSADFGKVKPSTDLFEMAINKVLEDHPDCTREDILFTGDNYSTDITGAHRARIKVAWINREGAPDTDGIATYQIKEITELQTLIKRLAE